MCGIAGILQYKSSDDAFTLKQLGKMLDIMRHRGPDGEGCFVAPNISMGMRRLSIIDLKTGDQPIFNENKTVVIVCNGEIYNFVELRYALLNKGHTFSTKSDVEVILHLYEEYGPSCLAHLNGMFSFALWDIAKQELFLARDRIGEKPLYYSCQNDRIVFASEIKAILSTGFSRSINAEALHYLVTYNYVPFPNTMFQGVMRLPPGYYAIGNKNGLTLSKYWEVPRADYDPKSFSPEKQYIEEIDELLEESVKVRLRSDVPVGAFLSGGVDSSGIVGVASRFFSCKTFSIGFNEKDYDESHYAKRVADYYKMENYKQIVDSEDWVKKLAESIWLNDEPHGDVSFIPTLQVSELASKQVKVVLTGDGGDELFAGYDKYSGFLKQAKNTSSIEDYIAYGSVFSTNETIDLFHPNIADPVNIFSPLRGHGFMQNGESLLDAILRFDMIYLLEGNNLVKPDRMGLGRSLEARLPFLDPNLIEYVTQIPAEWKLRHGETKYILKKVFEKFVPRDIVYAPKRMFTVPIGNWMQSELKWLTVQVLLSERALSRGIFNPDYVSRIVNEHISGLKNRTRQIRLLLVFELWCRIFIDNFYYSPPELPALLDC